MDEALAMAAEQLKAVDPSKLAVVLSAQDSTEDNYALVKLAKGLGAERFYLAALGGWEGDDILRNADNNPNRAGAEQVVGHKLEKTVRHLVTDAQSGLVQSVIALGWASAEHIEELTPLVGLDTVISLTSNLGALPAVASLVVPVASCLEMDGTFTNAKGMAQEFSQAVQPPAGIEPAWKTIAAIADGAGHSLGFTSLSKVRAELTPQEEAAQ